MAISDRGLQRARPNEFAMAENSPRLSSPRLTRPPIAWVFHPEESAGPILHVFLPHRGAVQQLTDSFQRVGDLGLDIDLARQPGIEFVSVSGVTLSRSDVELPKKLVIDPSCRVSWSCTRAEWFTNAWMLEPFRRGEKGHQYLTAETDDAVVVVSFGEDP